MGAFLTVPLFGTAAARPSNAPYYTLPRQVLSKAGHIPLMLFEHCSMLGNGMERPRRHLHLERLADRRSRQRANLNLADLIGSDRIRKPKVAVREPKIAVRTVRHADRRSAVAWDTVFGYRAVRFDAADRAHAGFGK